MPDSIDVVRHVDGYDVIVMMSGGKYVIHVQNNPSSAELDAIVEELKARFIDEFQSRYLDQNGEQSSVQ